MMDKEVHTKVELVEVGEFPDISYKDKSRRTIEEILRPVDVSFSVENVSRATTHEICESLDSYTQQSMRYVKMGENAFIVPPMFSGSLKKEFVDSNKILLDNYMKLSEIKDEFKDSKGRPKIDWFKFAPIEDNRYGLSLASPSNILVTMNGSRIMNFFSSLSDSFESRVILDSISPYLPKELADLCKEELGTRDFELIEEVHRDKLDLALLEGTYVEMLQGRFQRAGLGALTSTNSLPPSEILAKYKKEGIADEQLMKVASRVFGYGHESIVEHSRFGCGLKMSLVTRHQYERHRLKDDVIEAVREFPLEREVVIPPKILENQEGLEIFQRNIDIARNLREKIMNENPEYNHFALLNGSALGVYSTMNARTFYHMAHERLCNNAQWEIRGLMEGLALDLRKGEPELYKNCVPKCVLAGKCPEGALSCGKFSEVKQKYSM